MGDASFSVSVQNATPLPLNCYWVEVGTNKLRPMASLGPHKTSHMTTYETHRFIFRDAALDSKQLSLIDRDLALVYEFAAQKGVSQVITLPDKMAQTQAQADTAHIIKLKEGGARESESRSFGPTIALAEELCHFAQQTGGFGPHGSYKQNPLPMLLEALRGTQNEEVGTKKFIDASFYPDRGCLDMREAQHVEKAKSWVLDRLGTVLTKATSPKSSGHPNLPVKYTVLNDTSVPYEVHWIDAQGVAKLYRSLLSPGERFSTNTYTNHVWRLTPKHISPDSLGKNHLDLQSSPLDSQGNPGVPKLFVVPWGSEQKGLPKDGSTSVSALADWPAPKRQEALLFGKQHGAPCPKHVVQGSVGNCWMFQVLLGCLPNPETIPSIFGDLATNPGLFAECLSFGVFVLRLYLDSDGVTPYYLVIDDFVPCSSSGALELARCVDSALWPLLIEKAMAKLAGSFGRLQGDRENSGRRFPSVLDTHRVLGGGATQQAYEWSPATADAVWSKERPMEHMAAVMQRGGTLSLSSARFAKSALTNNLSSSGIVYFHGYGVLSIHCIDPGFVILPPGEENTRVEAKLLRAQKENTNKYYLIKISNTWADTKWNGDWCRSSPLWDFNPELRAKFHDSPSHWDDASMLIMDEEDFKVNYSIVWWSQ